MIHEAAVWVFEVLCHQDAERCWAPGGMPLALCQRCTGVYVGAAFMVLLLPLMRFRPTKGLAVLHAGFVLQMVLLGLHFVPHPASVRTLSGQLFAVGVLYFLWGSLRHRWAWLRGDMSPWGYLAGVCALVLALQGAVRAPFAGTGVVLDLLALCGALVIVLAAALTLADLGSRAMGNKGQTTI
jgi:uncharacterized membrane protein